MKPAAFDYVRAEHLDEALDVLGREGGDARIIAGGQSLMAMLNMRLARPRTLIDIMRLAELGRSSAQATARVEPRSADPRSHGRTARTLLLVALALRDRACQTSRGSHLRLVACRPQRRLRWCAGARRRYTCAPASASTRRTSSPA